MAKLSIGSISTFNHEIQDWSLYKARLEQWFMANDLGDSEDKPPKCKRRAVLLSSFSENTYKLVRDLALPADITTADYDTVIKLLDDHFKSVKCGFAERYKFHSATQALNESFAEWAARVRGLAAHCSFSASTLSEALRDRFVLGMVPGPERDKLFTVEMSDLPFSKAVELAEGVRCARQGASETIPGASLAARLPDNESLPVLKMAASSSRAPWQARRGESAAPRPADANRHNPVVCPVCGYRGHEAVTCKFTQFTCKLCGVLR